VSTTGLAATPEQYRSRLDEQRDAQIDAWVTELVRDLSIRRGVRAVIGGFCRTTGLNATGFERVFAAGGGAPSTVGRTAEGDLMVPAIELWCLVPGIRQELPDSRARLIDYLVANFHEMTYT
jgi:hypothetical protein